MEVTTERKLEYLFYDIFPYDMFEVQFDKAINIEHCTISKKITVRCQPELFYITHEMAHIVETPNESIFKKNFNLEFPIAYLSGTEIRFNQYKTEVPFKRELRVFGIQYSIAHYANLTYGLKFPMNTHDYIVGSAKKNLIGSTDNPRPYISPTLATKSIGELSAIINKKIFEYGEQYHYKKLPAILERKFDYMRTHAG